MGGVRCGLSREGLAVAHIAAFGAPDGHGGMPENSRHDLQLGPHCQHERGRGMPGFVHVPAPEPGSLCHRRKGVGETARFDGCPGRRRWQRTVKRYWSAVFGRTRASRPAARLSR